MTAPIVWRFGDALVWIVDIDSAPSLAPATAQDLMGAASGGGPARVMRRRVIRTLAGDWMGVHPQSIQLATEANGRPTVIAPRSAHLSVAQRGRFIAAAVCDQAVGVDVETGDAQADPHLETMTPPCDDLPFPLRWAIHEAVVKLMGTGLTDAPQVNRLTRTGPAEARAETVQGTARVSWQMTGGNFVALSIWST